MRNIWVFSDPHYDHANILKFTDGDGNRIRPSFETVEQMNECMIEAHNSVVKPGDLYYNLGDVTFKPGNYARIACRLNGKGRLIVGNHDDVKNYELTRWFEKVSLWRIFKEYNLVMSHLPMREDQFRGKVEFCVHGHIHQNKSPNANHLCVSMEHLKDYKPRHIDDIVAELKARPEWTKSD